MATTVKLTSNIFASVMDVREATDPRSSISPTVATCDALSSSGLCGLGLARVVKRLIGERIRGISVPSNYKN